MMDRRLPAFYLFCALLTFGLSTSGPTVAQEPLQSPANFLGYELGAQFTPHHRVMEYVRHVADRSPGVQLQQYGTTYEGRPLVVAFVSSPEDVNQLEAIRQNNLKQAGLASGSVQGPAKAIVWLSYNVHGNESVSTEAAMKTLYDLADPNNARTQAWLDDVVVAIDPCLNPDGRERYVQWYTRTAGRFANPAPEAREHDEPWPGGRSNHYYFDLNRDWAWGVQKETRQRLQLYNRWMPHVHVDFHEMGVNEPYYFAPAAKPFHENITAWQRTFQTTIGKNHATYFDRNHWLYFTEEVFDLYYPGYGDTWPLFNGAIGMTYEQGGSGRAGLAVETANGDTLTLRERMLHHHTTGLSTVEVTARHSDEVMRQFQEYYATAQTNPPGEYEAYVVRRGNHPDRLQALAAHLDEQHIRYGYADREHRVRGFSYETEETRRVTVAPGDLVIDAHQPKSRLAKVLFEPNPDLADSLTYDITAWALPYAYGLNAYALTERLQPDTQQPATRNPLPNASTETPYAYLAEWKSVADVAFLGAVLRQGVKARFAIKPFTLDGQTYPRGTIVMTRAGNTRLGARFDRIVDSTAAALGQPVQAVGTGFTPDGPDFGSDNVPVLDRPNVAVLSGAPLSSYSVGEVWHYFDRQIRYPVTLMEAEGFEVSDLDEYNVLVLPSGRYGSMLDEEMLSALKAWVREGGRLVAVDGAVAALAGQDGFVLKRKESESDTAEAVPRDYSQRRRNAATEGTPGSIHRVRLDHTHPLGFGFGDTYYTLKRDDDAYKLLEDDWNIGILQTGTPVSGFMGAEAQKKLNDTLVFGVQEMGDGAVVYLIDNPLFRGFWHSGTLLFGNAVFLVGKG